MFCGEVRGRSDIRHVSLLCGSPLVIVGIESGTGIKEANMKLTILHTNDVHAEYDNWLKCAALIKQRRADLGSETCLVLDTGDHFDMSVNECGLSGGKLHLDLLADVGVDGFTPGNNEFYRASRETLTRLTHESPFPWILSTVEEKDGSAFAGLKKGIIIQRGIAVGLLGALDPMEGAAEKLHGLRSLDLVDSLARGARELRAGGAQIVMLLSHCGLNEDLRLAGETGGLIDVIIGGHSHTELQEPRFAGRTIIVQAGGHGKYVGELELTIEDGRIAGHRYVLHKTASLPAGDPAQDRIMEMYREAARKVLNEELFILDEELPRLRIIRLAAELVRRKYDAALGIMFEPAATGGLGKGPVRVGDIHDICRSFITPAAFEISGRQIEGLLRERRDSTITGAQGFGIGFRPQGLAFGKLEFAGLTWEENTAGVSRIRVNGEPLDPERWYLAGAATHLFSSEMGGYPSMDGSRNIKFERFRYLRDELVDFFRSGEAAKVLREMAS